MKRLCLLTIISVMAMPYAASAQIKTTKSKQQDTIPGILINKQVIKVEGAKVTFTKETKPLEMVTVNGSLASKKASDSTVSLSSTTSGVQNGLLVAPESSAGATFGQLDVSPTGAAIYNVPISLPPGLGNMVPKIALSYSSQSGNGVVGLGWNITGLSAITRIASNTFHDDKITAVNFNANDRFALDGQRLILKSGNYGGDGAEYHTENYSNIKIVSRGVSPFGAGHGPAYFEVFNPDGSKAVYGGTSASRTSTSYALTYVENALGARINYTYSVSGNTLIVTEIAYGNLGSSQTLNKVTFNYEETNRAEMGFTGGDRLYRKSLLDNILVTANGVTYRKYGLVLENVAPLNYKRLTRIVEYNVTGTERRSLLEFTYNNTGNLVTGSTVGNLSWTGISGDNSEVITADYDGDGKMDFILKDRYGPSSLTFFTDIEKNASLQLTAGKNINTGYFKDIFTGNILTADNKILPRQGITLVRFGPVWDTFKFDNYHYTAEEPILFQYSRTWENVPKGPAYFSECDQQTWPGSSLVMNFYSGDFNGDGLLDIIAINNPEVITHQRWEYVRDPYDDQLSQYECINEYGEIASSAHFINMDRRITSNFVTDMGQLTKALYPGERIYSFDFNGDGKTDILHVKHGEMLVYGLNASNTALELLWQTTNGFIKNSEQALLGDYNGDGKTDIIFSTGYNSSFAVFISTGRGFDVQTQVYPFTNVEPKGIGAYFRHGQLIPTDVNNDGKTDIIEVYNYTQNTGGTSTITVHHNMGTSPAMGQHFENGGSVGISSGTHNPIPIFLNLGKQNSNMEFGLISMNAIRLLKYEKDFKSEAQLASISQDGVVHNITYKTLVESNDGIDEGLSYTSSYDQSYPNLDLHSLFGLSVVDKITRSYNNAQVQKVFGYSLGVSNLYGLGFLGFGKLVRSNWHVDDYDQNRIFEIVLSDPQLRGTVVKTFTSKLPSVGPIAIGNPSPTITDYLTRADYTYHTNLMSNKVFVNVPTVINRRDLLNGTSNVLTNEYDTYYNVTKVTNSFGSTGTKTEEVSYDNNPSGYYIGRPLTRKVTMTADGDSHSTEEEYTYTGYLPTQIKRRGHGTPWVTETNTYDAFGNLTQKSVATPTSGTRTSSAIYDNTGRFPISQTDVEGRTSTASYDSSFGTILSSTNHLGRMISFAYDGWDRIIEEEDYLGNKKYTTYGTNSDGFISTESDGQGQEKKTYSNPLGQITQITNKTLTGGIVGVATEYDVYGRAYRISQPGVPGSYSQWNTTEFDQYGRAKKVTAYTGKTVQYSYSGLSSSINDGTKTVTTTKNALGQTIQVQDPGGTVDYKYYAHGGLKSTDYGGSIQSLEYDGWGRKTKLVDPSAGVYTYSYNGFDEIVQQTTPKGTTSFTFDSSGKLTAKSLSGDATNINYSYSYNSTTKLLEGLTFTNNDGNNATYAYTYDEFNRLIETVEDNLHARFSKGYTYDFYGRPNTETYNAKDKANNVIATRTIGYTYQNGARLQVTDLSTGKIIWKINSLKSNGQVETALQGSNLKTTYNYDSFNLPQSTATERIGNNPGILMNLGYSFDPVRGNLNSRSNSAFGWAESFTYDNLNRLTAFNDNNGNNSQSYDARGRIIVNSQLGNYGYNGDSYQQIELTSLTASADNWYQDRSQQQISYNAFKKPVRIYEYDQEQIDFLYNASLQRSHMFYGSDDADIANRPLIRHYSEDGGMEITRDLNAGKTSFVFYLSGDAYSAPAIYKEVHNANGTTNDLYYLHRDHLGSILLISDVDGNLVEKRQFDAWGNLVKLEDGAGNPLAAFRIIDRGYTGHEHLLGVGLINMNGRLYDPKLHRFISPDNFVQDPTSTQNFNRYGYAMNNPFMYTDPSGEILWFVPVLIGAGIGILANGIDNAVNNRPFFQGALKAGVIGGLTGLASFGIGQVAGGLSGFAKLAYQTVAHGALGSFSSAANGGDFLSGFASGALGSLASSGMGSLLNGANDFWEATGTVASGSLMGGVSAEISGGRFWDGFRNGAISSGLNHVAHVITDKIEKAQRLAKQHKINSDRIVAETIMMEVLAEGTEFGDIITKAREKYVETYASKTAQQVSEDFSVMMDVFREFNQSLGKNKLSNTVRYKIIAGLAADVTVLQGKNVYLEYRIKNLSTDVYYNKIEPNARPFNMGGGGSWTSW